jgi:hypothetical protein
MRTQRKRFVSREREGTRPFCATGHELSSKAGSAHRELSPNWYRTVGCGDAGGLAMRGKGQATKGQQSELTHGHFQGSVRMASNNVPRRQPLGYCP